MFNEAARKPWAIGWNVKVLLLRKIVTGVVGPYSLAEETQNWFHDIIGSGHAIGWDS